MYITTSSVGGFPSFHTFSSIGYRLFNDDHSDQYEVVPCNFDLIYLVISDVEHLLMSY